MLEGDNMAALKTNSNALTEFFKEKNKSSDPSFEVGDYGIKSSTGGKQTVSQERAKYLKDINWKKRSPLLNYLEFGADGLTGTGEEKGRELQKEAIRQIKEEESAKQGSKKTVAPQKSNELQKQAEENKTSGKLYRVMFAGKGPESSILVDTKEEADRILAESGGKGAIAGVDMSRKPKEGTKAKVSNRNYLKGKLGEELPAEETAAKTERYISQMLAPQEKEKKRLDYLREYQSPEYKTALQERVKLANEAKRAKDKEAGAGFASWISDVKTQRDVPEKQLKDYSQSLSLLKNAYGKAVREQRYLDASNINEDIKVLSRGVPEEIGARRKAAREGLMISKQKEIDDYLKRKKEAEEAENRLSVSNPDYQQFNR